MKRIKSNLSNSTKNQDSNIYYVYNCESKWYISHRGKLIKQEGLKKKQAITLASLLIKHLPLFYILIVTTKSNWMTFCKLSPHA